MDRCACVIAAVGAVLGAVSGSASGSVVLGQVDTFESDTMNWGNSFGAPTTFWSDGGGPGGAGDPHMIIQTTGASSGPGSRLGAWNADQWTGDYLGQGITRIQIDMAGFTGPGAEMRLLIFSDSGAQFTTIESQFVPTDGVWRTYTFDISEDAVVRVGGLPDYQSSFGTIGRLQLRHQPGDPGGFATPPAYDGSIGVDNIRAVPGAPVLASGLMGGAVWGRRSRR